MVRRRIPSDDISPGARPEAPRRAGEVVDARAYSLDPETDDDEECQESL